MIYQEIDSTGSHFGVFSYRAEYGEQTVYGKSIQDVEDNIKQNYENSIMDIHENENGEMADVPPLVMPMIEPCALTMEQQARFNVVSVIQGITLDDVRGFTFEGKNGASVAFQLYAQENEMILQGQMITDLEISEIANAQALTELELLILGGK